MAVAVVDYLGTIIVNTTRWFYGGLVFGGGCGDGWLVGGCPLVGSFREFNIF